MTDCLCNLHHWTKTGIDTECLAAYRRYEKTLIDHYTRYFAQRPHLRCRRQRYSAKSLVDALPEGYAELLELIPADRIHRFARSGRSSQLLGLALLGTAAKVDPSLRWLWQAIGLPGLESEASTFAFEYALSPGILNEHPRVTQIDFMVSNEHAVAAVEMKLSEANFGACSCARDGDGDPAMGFDCSLRVRQRRNYWRVAHDCYGLDEIRLPLLPCSLSLAYQAIRITAAAQQIAQRRTAVFALIFDDRNPHFKRTGLWPGWPSVLAGTFRTQPRCLFRAVSWQQLLHVLPLPNEILRWAAEKHQLKFGSTTEPFR